MEPTQLFFNPFVFIEKYFGHFLLCRDAQGSRVKLNSASSLSNRSWGVSHSIEFELNIPLLIVIRLYPETTKYVFLQFQPFYKPTVEVQRSQFAGEISFFRLAI